MITVERTLKVVTPTKEYAVEELPPELKRIVELIDHWREEEANAVSRTQMAQSAIYHARSVLEDGIKQMETPTNTGTEK